MIFLFDIELKYPMLGKLFGVYFNQDAFCPSSEWKTMTEVFRDFLSRISDVYSQDIEELRQGRGTMSQFYSEVYDIVKRKSVVEQLKIGNDFLADGLNFSNDWIKAELFFLTLLNFTEAEMRRRGIEIPENPPLHTTTT